MSNCLLVFFFFLSLLARVFCSPSPFSFISFAPFFLYFCLPSSTFFFDSRFCAWLYFLFSTPKLYFFSRATSCSYPFQTRDWVIYKRERESTEVELPLLFIAIIFGNFVYLFEGVQRALELLRLIVVEFVFSSPCCCFRRFRC